LYLNRFTVTLLKRFNETVQGGFSMVDLAIAANFVRELTEEQFTPAPRTPRRAQATGRESRRLQAANGDGWRPQATGRKAQPAPAERRADPGAHGTSSEAPVTATDRRRRAATPITRVLSRLAHLP
jgi:hypothetical protein